MIAVRRFLWSMLLLMLDSASIVTARGTFSTSRRRHDYPTAGIQTQHNRLYSKISSSRRSQIESGWRLTAL